MHNGFDDRCKRRDQLIKDIIVLKQKNFTVKTPEYLLNAHLLTLQGNFKFKLTCRIYLIIIKGTS